MITVSLNIWQFVTERKNCEDWGTRAALAGFTDNFGQFSLVNANNKRLRTACLSLRLLMHKT
jgi:hypothetical protein